MKFLRFIAADAAKGAEVSQVADKLWASPPKGIKALATYTCLGIAFPGLPPHTVLSIVVVEAESDEAMAAVTWPLALAGAEIWHVPVLEVPVVGAAEVEKKMRG